MPTKISPAHNFWSQEVRSGLGPLWSKAQTNQIVWGGALYDDGQIINRDGTITAMLYFLVCPKKKLFYKLQCSKFSSKSSQLHQAFCSHYSSASWASQATHGIMYSLQGLALNV